MERKQRDKGRNRAKTEDKKRKMNKTTGLYLVQGHKTCLLTNFSFFFIYLCC